MAKAKRFTKDDMKKIAMLQKLENDANEAKKNKKWEEAESLLKQCVTGWKEIIAEVDSGSIKKLDTNPDVKFETDDLTRKIFNDYFGITITDK